MKRVFSYSQQKNTCIKIITILLVLCMVMMLFGCGDNNKNVNNNKELLYAFLSKMRK